MSGSIQLSPALLRSLANRPPMSAGDALLANAYLTGAASTEPARPRPKPNVGLAFGARRLTGRKWQSSPDKRASMHRKRRLGGCSGVPADMRQEYTEGERASLAVIAGEVKHHGVCDLAIDGIAAVAGVSRTTVQNAIRKAKVRLHLLVEQRPRKGMKNLTNIIRITASSWLAWIKRAPSLAREIGFNLLHPTKNQDISSSPKKNNERKNRNAAPSGWVAMGFGRGSKPSWRVLAHLLGQGDPSLGWKRLLRLPRVEMARVEDGFSNGTLSAGDISKACEVAEHG